MRIVCWQAILLKYHTLFFPKLGKMSQNLSSVAVVIGALWVKKRIRFRILFFKRGPHFEKKTRLIGITGRFSISL